MRLKHQYKCGNFSPNWKGGVSKDKEYLKERSREYHKKYYSILKNIIHRKKEAKKYRNNPKNKLKHKEYMFKYNLKNRGYLRQHLLTTTNRSYGGIIKRVYPRNKKCELCGKIYKRLVYHHWDDRDLKRGKFVKGLWICCKCHRLVEAIEYDCKNKLRKKYLSIKKQLEKNNAKAS